MYIVQYRTWYGDHTYLWWTFGDYNTLDEARACAAKLLLYYAGTDVRILAEHKGNQWDVPQ